MNLPAIFNICIEQQIILNFELPLIRIEAMEAIMHLKGISGAFDNWLGLTPLNIFHVGTPKIHTTK